MKVIDLTHVFQEKMSFFPGADAPILEQVSSVDKDGYKVTRIDMTTHLGTHLDCKAHVFEDGFTTSSCDVNKFFGQAVLIDCSMVKEGEEIGVDILKKYDLSDKDFVLIYTGWDKYWRDEKYIGDFPVLSKECAEYLAESNIKGIGLDVISIDKISDAELVNHKIVLGKDIIVVENLKDLDKVVGKNFKFSAFPLKIKDGDGCPVRAVAIIE